jgi:A/G-specific adenine glycosylase
LPTSHDEWLKLPGIGAYTAAAIASITANEPFGVVDGNVERVLCRMMDVRSEPNLPHLKKAFKVIMDNICKQTDPGSFNQAVMELGQTICTPTNPSCERCPVSAQCLALKHSSQHLAPAPKKKKKSIDISLELQIIKTKDGIALFKRPPDAKFLPGTWGFVTYINSGDGWELDGTNRGVRKVSAGKVGEIQHSITSHKIKAIVTFSKANSPLKTGAVKFTSRDDVESSLVSNLDRKAWNVLLRSAKQHLQ